MDYDDNFRVAVTRLLKIEQGFVNNPDDPGGATNYGISLRFLLRSDPTATESTIRNLTESDAKMLYYFHWWKRYGYDKITVRGVAAKMLDTSVHIGPYYAHRILQESCNLLKEGVAVDGLLGPLTIDRVNSTPIEDQKYLRMALTLSQIRYYASCKRGNAFLQGWINRAFIDS